jgi:hypothetical protein
MRGQHGHRRGDRAPVGGQEATGPSTTIRRPQLAPPGAPGGPLLPGALGSGGPGALGSGGPGSLGGPGAAGWPAPGGWQGGGLGEIAHPPGPPMRPVIAPVPRTANPLRGGRSSADANPSTPPTPPAPPWAPAPEPDQTSEPFPVAPVGSFAPPPGSGLRVPRDVPRPPAFTARPPGSDTPAVPPAPDTPAVPPAPDTPAVPPAPDTPAVPRDPDTPMAPGGSDSPAALRGPDTPMAPRGSDRPAAAFGFDGPPTIPGFAALGRVADPAATGDPAAAGPGDRPDVTETATGQDVTEEATDPDMTRITGGAWTSGPAYGPDVPTRQGVDFAAAPVATGYPGMAPPGQGSGPVADPNSLWDLAATDVFPVAAPEPPDDEAPGASKS